MTAVFKHSQGRSDLFHSLLWKTCGFFNFFKEFASKLNRNTNSCNSFPLLPKLFKFSFQQQLSLSGHVTAEYFLNFVPETTSLRKNKTLTKAPDKASPCNLLHQGALLFTKKAISWNTIFGLRVLAVSTIWVYLNVWFLLNQKFEQASLPLQVVINVCLDRIYHFDECRCFKEL